MKRPIRVHRFNVRIRPGRSERHRLALEALEAAASACPEKSFNELFVDALVCLGERLEETTRQQTTQAHSSTAFVEKRARGDKLGRFVRNLKTSFE